MNALDLKKYWSNKYLETFGETYKAKNYSQEMVLLKRLLDRHNKYVILSAIDIFFQSKDKKVSSINFFATKKVFEGKFEDIIKLSDIIIYKRFLPYLPENIKEKVSALIQEYQDYSCCETISETEKVRKAKIAEELKVLTDGCITERN